MFPLVLAGLPFLLVFIMKPLHEWFERVYLFVLLHRFLFSRVGVGGTSSLPLSVLANTGILVPLA
jgi:hypothetical protein